MWTWTRTSCIHSCYTCTPTTFALASATKIDLDHLPELLGEMERLRAILWARLALRIQPASTDGSVSLQH